MPVTVDSHGRVRSSKEQRWHILAEFERSGVSAAEFARRNGIKYPTFAGWVQGHRCGKPKAPPPVLRLLEAVLEPIQGGTASAASLVVRLPGGTQIEITDPQQIPLATALLRALASPC